MIACICGSADMVTLLLDKGADINKVTGLDHDQGTALEAAIFFGRNEIVDLLWERGATLHHLNTENSPEPGSTDILKDLARYQPALLQRIKQRHLESAVWQNCTGAVQKFFLEEQTNVEFEELLELASRHGHLEMSTMLIDLGARTDPDSISSCHKTPLQSAASYGYWNVVRLLITKGANVNAFGIYETALTCAVKQGKLEMVKYLVEHGADVNLSHEHWGSPMKAAFRSRNAAVISYLLDQGAQVPEQPKGRSYQIDDTELRSRLHELGFVTTEVGRFPKVEPWLVELSQVR